MSSSPPKVVFDCNIFVQMLLTPGGSAAACKTLVENGEVILFVSKEILAEVLDVLSRPRFKQLIPDLTPERIEAFIEEITSIAVLIANVPEEFRYERDPEDEPYINLALVTGAKYIVSFDKDLLDLVNPAVEQSREFQRRYPMLRVITPVVLLVEIGQNSKRN
ncbi:MAG: putative toxin-antitoxin system toxin component, PIN family [Acidobacteriota bacterium]